MGDNYQAVYDAVRSRLGNCDVGRAIEEVARNAFDISHAVERVRYEFEVAGNQMQRPSVLFKPELSREGNQWCVLLGENLQVGLCAFGDTPALAFEAFDVAFYKELARSDNAAATASEVA